MKKQLYRSFISLVIDEVEDTCDVYFAVEPGDPGVHTYPNGDPGYPPTGPEIVIRSVVASDGGRILEEWQYEDKIEEINQKILEKYEAYLSNNEPDDYHGEE
jgi:hypothetical protein